MGGEPPTRVNDDDSEITAVHMSKRVWDLPVRIFHWLLVACIATLWFSRGAVDADLHAAAGYAVIALLVFRVVWGFIGTGPARFASFLYSPRAAVSYLAAMVRSSSPTHVSHNPAGSWSIYVMLALAAICCVSGLVAFGGEKLAGPLAGFISPVLARVAHAIHQYAAWTLLGVAGVHLLGVIVSSALHRENYAASMLHGAKRHAPAEFSPVPARAPAAAILAAAVAATFAAPLSVSGWGSNYAQLHATAKAAPQVKTLWQKECGECHVAYPPNLLPSRSWVRTLAEQSAHFGEDLSLSEKTLHALRAYADARLPATDWAGASIAAGIDPGSAPLRITETEFWIGEHSRIESHEYSKERNTARHQCEGCHLDVDSGIFRFRMIRRPRV